MRIISFPMRMNIRNVNITIPKENYKEIINWKLCFFLSEDDRQDLECCKYPPEHQHPNCMNIRIPHDDPFYKYFKRSCIDFARIYAGPKPGCKLGEYTSDFLENLPIYLKCSAIVKEKFDFRKLSHA